MLPIRKKHGIGKDNAPTGDASSSGANKISKKKMRQDITEGDSKNVSQGTVNTNTTMKSLSRPHASDSASSSSSDSEPENTGKKRVTYRRREIVSNWKRYEMDPETADSLAEKSKGESFEKLINMAGEAVARFRFKDELEWEHSNIEKESVSSAILDPIDLGQALQCLPLHEMLGIDPHTFTKDQLTAFEKSALKQRSQLAITKNPSTTTRSTKAVNANPTNGSEMAPPSPIKIHDNHSNTSSAMNSCASQLDSSLRTNVISGQTSENETQKPSAVKQNHVAFRKNGQPNQEQVIKETQLSLCDEDLDALLDMESPTSVTLVSSEKNVRHSSSSTNTVGESKEILKDTTDGAGEDLEDWLDSVLDS